MDPISNPAPLALSMGWPQATVSWLAGDGSDRSYFRIASLDRPESTYVLMNLSPEDAAALACGDYTWVNIASEWHRFGVRVPQVILALPEQGHIVIEDLGDDMFEHAARRHLAQGANVEVEKLYLQAVQIIGQLIKLEHNPALTCQQRAFDDEKFTYELNFFRTKFVSAVLGLSFSRADEEAFSCDVARLSQYLASLPRHSVHRDLHSRNLLLCPEGLAVIDFQDARLGPAAYDLVSLCFDSYVPLPLAERERILKLALIDLSFMCGEGVHQEISESWRPMLLQRQLKALGSFGYLTREKKRADYLQYVPAALETLSLCVDDRWPFLSQLPERIRSHIQSRPLGLTSV